MSVKRYLDINSTYRNRKTYPNVCDFVLEMSTNNSNYSAEASKDPVLRSFPFETNLLQGGSTVTQIVLSIEASNVLNFYRNTYLEINGLFRKIISYNNTTKVATVDTAFPVAYPVLTQYTIRYDLPTLYSNTSAISPALNKVVLSLSASSANNAYVNQWLFIPGPTPPSSYEWQRIIEYDGTTKVATVASNFSYLIPAGVNFQICAYSYDNVKSLKYFGTEVGTNNPVCCNINLVNLIVPNLPVLNGYAGTLQNYPYLYVCLYSEKGITYNNPIISNTPASDKALFKVPVTYLQNNSFLTLGYSGMNQKVSFRINDDLRFQILLPTGEPLEFDIGNLNLFNPFLPIPPNPLIQVQAVFDITIS
jgi:hypothetical protein